MAATLTKPFLGAPHTSTGSLHSPSLLPSRNIIQLPDRRSRLKRLGLTIGSPIKVYSETFQTSRAYCSRSMKGSERDMDREIDAKLTAGHLAKNLLKDSVGIDILAYVSQVHKVILPESLVDHETLTYDQIEASTIRCPDRKYAQKMIAVIDALRVRGDSIGGTVTCIVRNFPWSGGSMTFQEIAAVLAKGVISTPFTEGFEIGSGFTSTFMTDNEYIDESGQSDGIQDGIIKLRIAVKPISMRKNTVGMDKHKVEPIAPGLDLYPVAEVACLVEIMVAKVLLCKLIAEGGACLMSPTIPEPLKWPEIAKAPIPLQSSLDCFAALFCS